MGLKGLPTTYDGYHRLLRDYEAEHFAHTPAATRLAEATIRDRPRRRPGSPPDRSPAAIAIALMDEPLRRALGLPAPARVVRGRALRGALRLRARFLRHLATPRRTPFRHRPTTYPHGYTLADLGPASMLPRSTGAPGPTSSP